MPLIKYAGHEVLIDHAYSLARVSSPQQTDGEGLERQMRRSREWSIEYSIPIDTEFVVTASASKGYHIRKGKKLGPLGIFLKAADERKLKPNPVLLVESFSRLVRLLILDGFDVFRQIVNNGCALITLSSRRIYTRELINRDPGMIHTVVGELQSARTVADDLSSYSRYGYQKRRGKPTAICVSWLRLKDDRSAHDVIPGAEETLLRIFLEVEYLSVDRVAARLNAEGIPVFDSWNHRKPGRRIWYGSYITKIVRSRAVRGEVEMGEYGWKLHREVGDDGKVDEYQRWERTLKGQWVKSYPVISSISDQQWQRSNAALDARKTGRGPKGEDFANLFQSLAKCAHCDGSMKLISTAKVRRGQPRKRYHYYRCANSRLKACKGNNDRTYDYGLVEAEFLDVFQDIVFAYLCHAELKNDPATPVREQIAAKNTELFKLDEYAEAQNVQMDEVRKRTGATEDEIAFLVEHVGIKRQKAAVLAEIATLRRKLDQLEAQLPSEDVARDTEYLIAGLESLSENEQVRVVRSKINMQLRRFIARIDFDRDGLMRVIFGENGKPHSYVPHHYLGDKHESDYRIRFTPNGVEREHLYMANLRAISARERDNLSATELRDAWEAGNDGSRDKRLRPNERPDDEAPQ